MSVSLFSSELIIFAGSAKGTSRAAGRMQDHAKISGLGVPVLRVLCESAKGTSRAAERKQDDAKISGLGVPVLRVFM